MNNLPTSITTVRPKLPIITTNPISIESVDSSVQNLIKSWHRRQRWQHLFSTPIEQDLNKAKWRTQLAKFIESTPLHTIAITLLLLDLVLTILELSKSLISSPCTQERKDVEQVWYNWIGIAILGLLSLKSMALAVAIGGAFFRRPGYVVDGLAVVVALCLEAFLERKGGGLLVVASLWRVVRVVESAFELSDEAIEAQIEGIVWQFEAIREENIKLLEIIVEKDEIIDKLKEALDNCRITGIAYISNVAVREKFRRDGIAKKLIAKAEAQAKTWCWRAVALRCDHNNPTPTKLCKCQGFRCIKLPEGSNWLKPKTSPDVKFNFMMKLLNSPISV